MLTTTLALATLALAPAPGNESPSLSWFEGTHTAAIQEAISNEKMLLTYFWANTEKCSRLYSETMSNEAVIHELGDLVLYSANAGDDAGRAVLDKYHLTTIPALLLIGPNGEAEEMMLGFIDAPTLVNELQRIRRGENTISDLRGKVAGEHEDLEAELGVHKMLAEKLDFVGDKEGSETILAALLAKDPKSKTIVGASIRTNQLIGKIIEAGGDDATSWDLGPLEKFAKKVKSDEGRFNSHVSLAELMMQQENQAGAIKTLRFAWKKRPDSESMTNAGFGIIDKVAYYGEELSSKERKFALEVANDVLSLVETALANPKECAACADGEEGATVAQGEGDGEKECCGEGEGEDDGLRPYAMYQVARCQMLNGERQAATQTMGLVLELQPENEDYVAYLASLNEEDRS